MAGAEVRGRAPAGTPVGDAGGHLASTWVAGAPETRYAKSEDGYVAYQVFDGSASEHTASAVEAFLIAQFTDVAARRRRVASIPLGCGAARRDGVTVSA
jgi:hypothetical protein